MARIDHAVAFFLLAALTCLPAVAEASTRELQVREDDDGAIRAGDQRFESWIAYFQSDFFREHGTRCGTPEPETLDKAALSTLDDCSFDRNVPSGDYAPEFGRHRVTIVVHVIQSSAGQGFLSEDQVRSQIDILNGDFLALKGTDGENGVDSD